MRTSDVLLSLANGESERISVGEIVATLQHQAFALLVVVLALPNCLPMPPPIPLISGILLGLVAIQIMLGFRVPWLPQRLLVKTIARADVAKAVARAMPVLHRLERVSKARLPIFETPVGLRTVGAVLLLIAVGLLVSPPFIGQIPLGIAASLVGLGLVERDGAIACVGIGFGAVGITISASFVVAIITGIEALAKV